MTRTLPLLLAAALAMLSLPGHAASFDLPTGAKLRTEQIDPAGSYALPLGPWQEATGIETRLLSGGITRQAWRIGGTGLTSYQIFLKLRAQVTDQGYNILFECSTETCGGYDFRYGTEVIGEPEMHVDLGDYHFLSAEKPGDEQDVLSLLVSRSPSAGFAQIIQVGELTALPVEPVTSTIAEPDTALPATLSTELGPAMEELGRFVLADLVFNTGSADLGPGEFTSLTELADYLKANPEKRVALVGHTDAEGSLSGNISLSKRRAESVMARLVNDYGIPQDQLEAEGVGYLSPIASNQTEEGRTRNRRVEAILISTE